MRKFISPPIQFLAKLIEEYQRPGMKMAEVGVYDGSSTILYIDTILKNNGMLYVLDTFMGTKPSVSHIKKYGEIWNHPHAYGDWNKEVYNQFCENMSDYMNIIKPMVGESGDTIPLLPDDMDIIFIDADHKYSAVKNDIELSLKKIKRGGLLCGHDCEKRYDINNPFTIESEIDGDYSHVYGCHAGTVKAVYDSFGEDYNQTSSDGGGWWKIIN